MSGSEHIDPQMIRDRDGDVKALNQAIRDIEAEALKQQDRLSLARPKEQERPRWWRRPQGIREAGPQVIDSPGPDALIVETIHDDAPKVIHAVEVDSVDQGIGPSGQVIDRSGPDALIVETIHDDAPKVIHAVEVDSVDQGIGPSGQVIDRSGGETLNVDARVRPHVSRVIEAEALMTQARARQKERSWLSRWLHGA